ncbi:MAG: tRNA (adenosine(37)-N6)-threonylcarbamoyltransferase complex transferase subunit TsaD [Gammaproteobacteria bacterium]|nr:tRNA (adenosine(37)-N6)-threonylcarbamoyltransferase complex transferase subunit TsaD [Gammaproteobacteria bacterium]
MASISKITNVLGIETSCDETAVAIYNKNHGILSHKLYSQIKLHAQYGGVVPELASRDHIQKLLPLIDQCIQSAKLSSKDIHGIAYTKGPGLIGALLVGALLAKTLAYGWKIPSLGINHMEGHLLAPLLEDLKPNLPFIALLVSGGHTMLVKVTKLGVYNILGESIDDAAGEAFDKTAKLLGLGYPGGAALAKLGLTGDANSYKFPRPLTNFNLNQNNLDFSFSGLKTAALNTYNKSDKSLETKANIAASFQAAVIDTLFIKCKKALLEHNINQLVVAGGVSANLELRSKLNNLMQSLDGQLYLPRPEYCTDNGAMIAYAGYLRLAADQTDSDINNTNYSIVTPRWPISELTEITK